MNIRQKFEAWLDEHCTPQRTASGQISRSRGVVNYDDSLRLYLGGPIEEAVKRFRAGDDVAYRVKRAVEELVEAWRPEDILTLRRDQALEQELASGMRFFERHGVAPDGGEMRAWSRSVLDRLNRTYGVSGAPKIDVRGEPFEVTANDIRRQRMAA